jgi:hypothetical protein
MDGRVQGMRRRLRFTFEASPLLDTYKTALGPHAQRDLVRSTSALVPDRHSRILDRMGL